MDRLYRQITLTHDRTLLSETGFRCIAYDRRGHGRSSDPGRNFDYNTLADDLETVLDALHLNDVQVVAHSMSAGEVARYLSRPRVVRIQRIALIDPAWLDENARPFVTADTGADTIAWIKNMMLPCSLKAVLDCNRAMIEADFRAELKRIQIPTLIIHGDRDASAPLALTSRRIVPLMTDVRLTVYEGAPHGLPVTHAVRLNQELQAFLRTPCLSIPAIAARRSA